MTILSCIPVLHCHSIEDTMTFYQQLLQFVVVNKREQNGELHWVHLMHGETTLMLQAAEQQNPESYPVENNNISLYYFVNNINELHHIIKAKCDIKSVIKHTSYQTQEFNLLDPEGNTVTVGMAAETQS